MSNMKGHIKCKFHVSSVHLIVWDNPNPKKPGEFIPNVTLKRYYHNDKTDKYALADGFRENDLSDIVTAIMKYQNNDYTDENRDEYRA